MGLIAYLCRANTLLWRAPPNFSRRSLSLGILVWSHVPVHVQKTHARWAMDFMHDFTTDNKAFRALNVIDIFSRKALTSRVERKFTGQLVSEKLDNLGLKYGFPEVITCDNGLEFINLMLEARCHAGFYSPGNPDRKWICGKFHWKNAR